jgi:hypothetical protein
MLKKSIFSAGLLLIIPCLNANAQSQQHDWFYNPFNKNSAHHRPIGTGADYAGDNEQSTRDWLNAASRIGINVGIPYGRSAAAADSSTDPMVTVNPSSNSSNGGLPVSLPLPNGEFETHATGAGDSEVVIYDRHQDEIFELRKWNWNGGSPESERLWQWDIRGLGHGTTQGEVLGASASGTAGLFGVLRGWEANQSGQRIGHALQMVVPRVGDCPHLLSTTIVYPATNADWDSGAAENNSGGVPYGALFAIPPESSGGPNLDSLGLSEPGRRLAETLRDYGAYVVDGTGCSTVALRADQEVNDSIRQQMVDDSAKFYQYMRIVKNNSANQSVAGGGNPLAPNTAIDSDDSYDEDLPPPEDVELISIEEDEETANDADNEATDEANNEATDEADNEATDEADNEATDETEEISNRRTTTSSPTITEPRRRDR